MDTREADVTAKSGGNQNRNTMVWVLAVVITLSALVYQRLVGPTRPIRGTVTLGAEEVRYKIRRSFGGSSDYRVEIPSSDPAWKGYVVYRRFKTDDPWARRPMSREGDRLVGTLPEQPPGGKVVFRLYLYETTTPNDLSSGEAAGILVDPRAPGRLGPDADHGSVWVPAQSLVLPPEGAVVMRYRGHVSGWILWPHVVLMFLGMLWSNRTGLEALRRQPGFRRLTFTSLGLLTLGGLVFGPAVQWYAFGAAWTGFPVGYDLTDNKTLIAVIGWLIAAAVVVRGGRSARWWVLLAALVTLVIFSIPHSVLGTELDYSTLPSPENT